MLPHSWTFDGLVCVCESSFIVKPSLKKEEKKKKSLLFNNAQCSAKEGMLYLKKRQSRNKIKMFLD